MKGVNEEEKEMYEKRKCRRGVSSVEVREEEKEEEKEGMSVRIYVRT